MPGDNRSVAVLLRAVDHRSQQNCEPREVYLEAGTSMLVMVPSLSAKPCSGPPLLQYPTNSPLALIPLTMAKMEPGGPAVVIVCVWVGILIFPAQLLRHYLEG
jgi:hypothetical protein